MGSRYGLSVRWRPWRRKRSKVLAAYLTRVGAEGELPPRHVHVLRPEELEAEGYEVAANEDASGS